VGSVDGTEVASVVAGCGVETAPEAPFMVSGVQLDVV
jgi:hypothetical protein